MPASAIPLVGAVVAAVALVMIIIGGAGVWTSMSGRLHHDPREGVDDDL